MLRSRSQWQQKQHSEREDFRAKASDYLDEQFNELASFLGELQLSRTTHINSLIQSGEAELEKSKYEAEMKKLEKLREAEKEKLALEREHQHRLDKLAEAQAQAAEEREKSIEAAQKAAEKEARLAKEKAEKAAASKRENEERRAEEDKRSKEKAAKEKAEKDRADASAEAEKYRHANASTTTNGSAAMSQSNGGKQDSGRSQIDAEYSSYMDRIQWIKANVKDAMKAQPSNVRNHTMDIKLQLRPKFGMLTNSKAQLMECRNAVKSILASTKNNTLIYHWVLNLYAKMLVEQGESEANVKLQNALPLAMLTMLLWADFPELGDFVIPRIVKRCPQVIGYYCDIRTEEGRKRMGWKFDDDTGKYETQEKYMGRLSGICAVWACMTQTKLNTKVVASHPYPLSHSWTFVARQLNKPLSDVGPTDYSLVAAWWDMTAMRFQEAFGRQGNKVLDLVWDTWTVGKTDPPAMRLRGLGENWKSSGKIECGWEQMKP